MKLGLLAFIDAIKWWHNPQWYPGTQGYDIFWKQLDPGWRSMEEKYVNNIEKGDL